MKLTSIGIRKHFGVASAIEVAIEVASIGDGDQKITLWRSSVGATALETNGDPIIEPDAKMLRKLGFSKGGARSAGG